jgi:hypothetical protein
VIAVLESEGQGLDQYVSIGRDDGAVEAMWLASISLTR